MYHVVKKEFFGHCSVFCASVFEDAHRWMKGLEKTYGKIFKIIKQ